MTTTDDLAVLGEEIRVRLYPRPRQVLDPATGETVDGETPFPLPLEVHYLGVRLIFTAVRAIQRLPEDKEPERYRDEAGMPLPNLVRIEVEDVFATTVDLSLGSYRERAVALPESYGEDYGAALAALLRAVSGVE